MMKFKKINIQKSHELIDDVEFLDIHGSDEFQCYLRWKSKSDPLERDAFIGLYDLKQELGEASLRQFLDKEKEEIRKKLDIVLAKQ